MQTIEAFSVREATCQDIPAIVDIHNGNVRTPTLLSHQGFLLATTTAEEVLDQFKKCVQYWVAVDCTERIRGFVAFSWPKLDENSLTAIFWYDESEREAIMGDRHIYIHVVATQKGYTGQGIARLMYKNLERHFPNSVFSTFIVRQPICNQRSIQFHQQQGFKVIGKVEREQFLDLKNYESVLLIKRT